MIPTYNKKRCAAFPFETGIHFRRKTDFFPEEDTTMSYSGFEPEPTRLQAEGHSHHTGWATPEISVTGPTAQQSTSPTTVPDEGVGASRVSNNNNTTEDGK
ncbi:poly polymerase [Trichonephila clavipes]|nr:poly polymerase [Trichonephila clavipes]